MILLASRSPQRRSLLGAVGVAHRVIASRYPEDDIPGATPEVLVAAHAEGKARDVAARSGIPAGGAILAADTAVVIDGEALGKPIDRDDARAMLARLSGRTHRVLTAVHLITADGRETAFVDGADVTFADLAPEHVRWYLDRGEWQGRAGAYAIQGSGASLVRRVDGDVTTVIGLPVARLVAAFTDLGLAPWSGGGR